MGDRFDPWGGLNQERPKPYFWNETARGRSVRLNLDRSGPSSRPLEPAPTRSRRSSFKVRSPRRLILAALAIAIVAGSVYRDLSNPAFRAYYVDRYVQPSLKVAMFRDALKDASGRPVSVLYVSGKIGPASFPYFRSRLDETKPSEGDLVLLDSPGGDVDQAMLIGGLIRARNLTTAVGTTDDTKSIRAGYCASACALAFAGGVYRIGVRGSMLGVHRFRTSPRPDADAVADTQALEGRIIGYATSMGVGPAFVEAMSATDDVRWLTSDEASAMNLTTTLW